MNLNPGIPETLANACGFAGMLCVVCAYGYSTNARTANPFIQHSVNLAGAALLTISLLVNTNPASLALEAVWSAIAISGLVRAARARKARAEEDKA